VQLRSRSLESHSLCTRASYTVANNCVIQQKVECKYIEGSVIFSGLSGWRKAPKCLRFQHPVRFQHTGNDSIRPLARVHDRCFRMRAISVLSSAFEVGLVEARHQMFGGDVPLSHSCPNFLCIEVETRVMLIVAFHKHASHSREAEMTNGRKLM
jgi:hypothetical protein